MFSQFVMNMSATFMAFAIVCVLAAAGAIYLAMTARDRAGRLREQAEKEKMQHKERMASIESQRVVESLHIDRDSPKLANGKSAQVIEHQG